jgi:hypothetical protein
MTSLKRNKSVFKIVKKLQKEASKNTKTSSTREEHHPQTKFTTEGQSLSLPP